MYINKKETNIPTKKNEEYLLQVQDLMDAISTSSEVQKHVDKTTIDDETYSFVKWVIDGYVVHSELRDVYSTRTDDTEGIFEFILKANDYKKFAKACEARRAETLKQIKVHKK